MKYVYTFGNGQADGSADMKNLLGGKGANLAEMSHLGIPVPPGFTVTTDVCTYYYDHDSNFPIELEPQIAEALKSAGYPTSHFGKWHLGSVRADSEVAPGKNGFDEWA